MVLITVAGYAEAAPPASDYPLASPHYGTWGFDLAGMDPSVRPGDNFFNYANGAWLQRTTIPANATKTGYFSDLNILADKRTRKLVEDAAAAAGSDGDRAKIGALYRAFMDTGHIEALADQPLLADLRRLRGVVDRDALAVFMADKSSGFSVAPFEIELEKDLMAPDNYAVYLSQGVLGMPTRDYYLMDQFADKKRAYASYIAHMLALAKWDAPEKSASAVLAFESRMAEASWTINQQRAMSNGYVGSDVRDLQLRAPGFDWPDFLRSAGLAVNTRLVLSTDSSITAIAAIVAATPLDTLKAWEAFRMADAASRYLSREFSSAHFAFHSTVLAGQPQQPERWTGGIAAVNDVLGAAVGKLYVAAYLPDGAIEKMRTLTDNLQAALRLRIDQLTWMSEETKAEARRKLAGFEIQIGAPKVERDYRALTITADDLYGDIVRARAVDWQRRLALLNRPWDKSGWRFWPQDATAYNENGQLIFTAGMLQAPFFDPAADAAINYGTMGAVIGHELTHNFDDQGRHIDAQRRLRDWWRVSDAERFQASGRRLSAQFSATEILPGLHLNGDATLGENIADLGGLTIALTAYHLSLHGQAAPLIDGYTGDQRVFLGWAQGWRQKMRDDALRRQVASDVHSPAAARVNNILRNIDEWYDAFHVVPGDALYLAPAERVHVW